MVRINSSQGRRERHHHKSVTVVQLFGRLGVERSRPRRCGSRMRNSDERRRSGHRRCPSRLPLKFNLPRRPLSWLCLPYLISAMRRGSSAARRKAPAKAAARRVRSVRSWAARSAPASAARSARWMAYSEFRIATGGTAATASTTATIASTAIDSFVIGSFRRAAQSGAPTGRPALGVSSSAGSRS